MEIKRLFLCATCAALGLSIFTANAYAIDGFVEWDKAFVAPSIYVLDSNGAVVFQPNIKSFVFGCYEVGTFKWINCRFTLTVRGPEDLSDSEVTFDNTMTDHVLHGGHTTTFHLLDQPFISLVPNKPGYVLEDPRDANVSHQGLYGISVDTVNPAIPFNWGIVSYALPENSSAVWVETDLVLPTGYRFAGPRFTSTDSRTHETDIVGISGLQLLPPVSPDDPNANYFFARSQKPEPSGDPGHGNDAMNPDGSPDLTQDLATWGTPTTLQVLKTIANEYARMSPTQAKLRINDISLLEGGMFDIRDDWNTVPIRQAAHIDHRLGRAFDVDTTDGNGVAIICNDSTNPNASPLWLQVIAEEEDIIRSVGGVNPFIHLAPLDCERTGNLHLNVNMYAPLEITPISIPSP